MFTVSPSYVHLPHIVHLIICSGNTISIFFNFECTHRVATLLCKSYSGCFVLSFLKVQCPFYLWLIRTTVLQRYLALIPTRIFIITATSSHWLIIVKLCSVLYYQVRLDNGVSMHKLVALISCIRLPKTNNPWAYILTINQSRTAYNMVI